MKYSRLSHEWSDAAIIYPRNPYYKFWNPQRKYDSDIPQADALETVKPVLFFTFPMFQQATIPTELYTVYYRI